MVSLPPEIVEAVERAWAVSSAGELIVVPPGLETPVRVGERLIPGALRQAVEAGAPTAHVREGQLSWWAASHALSEGARLRLVAWGEDGAGHGETLRAWAAALGTLLDIGQASQGMTDALVDAWDRLAFLYDLAQIAGRALDLEEMLRALVDLLAKVGPPHEVVLIAPAQGGEIALTASGGAPPTAEARAVLRDAAAPARRPLTLHDLHAALAACGSGLAQCSDLLVTALPAPSGIGVLAVCAAPGQRFDSRDMQFVASVAEQVSIWLATAETRSARAVRVRLEHELALAADLQARLLPSALPHPAGLEMAAALQPARRVGGDLYHARTGPDGAVLVLLADVAGRGMPAALLTAVVHALFTSESVHHQAPAALLESIGRLMYADLTRTGTFVTALIARLAPDGVGFSYASAGHADGLWLRAETGALEPLPATGLPLGVDEQARYGERGGKLAPGDALLLLTDGVVESAGEGGDLFGLEGVADIIEVAQTAPAAEQIRLLTEALRVHRGSVGLRDDVAAVMVRRPGAPVEGEVVTPFIIPAQPASARALLEKARRTLQAHLSAAGDGLPRFIDEFVLSLSEIVTNQIQHAYGGRPGRIAGCLRLTPEAVQADLFDRGVPFDAGAAPASGLDPANPPDHGYGLRLARGLLDACDYDRSEGGRNHWRLRKRRLAGEIQ